jgi:hypothetical protein
MVKGWWSQYIKHKRYSTAQISVNTVKTREHGLKIHEYTRVQMFPFTRTRNLCLRMWFNLISNNLIIITIIINNNHDLINLLN